MDSPSGSGSTKEGPSSLRAIVATMLPLALAIFIFGCIYGVLARPLLGVGSTLLSSTIIFSGSLQFAIAGLGAGASAASIFALAITLNMRHVLLGAVVRKRVEGSAARRAAISWFLTDETFGVAIASKGEAGRTLLVTGAMGYSAWIVGTAIGLAGASLASFENIAAAAFPVLFLGLAATSASTLDRWVRVAIAGISVGLIAAFVPSLESLAAVFVAVVVAIPGGQE